MIITGRWISRQKVTLFCRLLSLYENELEITDRFGHMEHVEYAIIQRT